MTTYMLSGFGPNKDLCFDCKHEKAQNLLEFQQSPYGYAINYIVSLCDVCKEIRQLLEERQSIYEEEQNKQKYNSQVKLLKKLRKELQPKR